MAEKMTKMDWYEVVKQIVDASDYEQKDEAIEFLEKQMDQLAVKAEKARERASAKKKVGDAMKEAVLEALTDHYQYINEIVANVDFEDVTKAKVTSRLSQLVRDGIVVKELVKDEAGRKLAAYKLV